MDRRATGSIVADAVYQCYRCNAFFASRRERCTNCGKVRLRSRLDRCSDCDASLLPIERRACPLCGSGNVGNAGPARGVPPSGAIGHL